MACVLLAEGLFPLTAVLTAGVLTRRLGPDGYGQLTLVVSLTTLVQSNLQALFGRATIKFLRQAEDWRSVGAVVVRYQLLAGWLAAGAVCVAADEITRLLGTGELAPSLRLMAMDIPLFNVGMAYRQILVGRGGYRQRAFSSAVRWSARVVLVVGLVEMGLGVKGAIVGLIGTSCVDLGLGRSLTRLPLLGRGTLRLRDFAGYAVPLFVFSLCQSTFERMDLFLLKALGASAGEAGLYGAAQNLELMPVWIALAVVSLALSTVSQLLAQGNRAGAEWLGGQVLRGAVLLLPLAGLVAGAAPAILGVIYGAAFAAAAPVLAALIFATVGQVVILVTATLLTAFDRPRWCLALGVPLVLLALIGHLLTIPAYGAVGASMTTASVSGLAAACSLVLMYRLVGIAVPLGTFVHAVGLTAAGYALTRGWPAPGAWVLLQLPAATVVVALALVALGEFRSTDLRSGRLPALPETASSYPNP
jgi:O-antigen/teichoic acid export membrane protein